MNPSVTASVEQIRQRIGDIARHDPHFAVALARAIDTEVFCQERLGQLLSDGWIDNRHNPVPDRPDNMPETVDLLFRCGDINERMESHRYRWDCPANEDASHYDIVAWRPSPGQNLPEYEETEE